jgi:hypothetical protein
MPNRLPMLAVILGAGGLIPFIGCAMGIITLSPWWVHVSLFGLIGYGACILSFLGAVHWGIELSHPTDPTLVHGGTDLSAAGSRAASTRLLSVHYARLSLGVIPALIGWVALLALSFGLASVAIAILIAGFVAVLIVETQASRLGLLPYGYIWLRYVLSAIVIVLLVSAGVGVLFVPRIVY